MELLTILYAFLAAVTGIGGGERVALGERAAIAAPADCHLQIGSARSAKAVAVARQVRAASRIVLVLPEARAARLPKLPALFDMASFANRRQ